VEPQPIRIAVIAGTTREERFSAIVAEWALSRLAAQGARFEELDLLEHDLPFFDGPAPAEQPRRYPNNAVARFGRAIDACDGFVLLSADYNHGYPAPLKNAMDWLFAEWRHKPVAFIGWGYVGGAISVEQLRQVAVGFDMVPVRQSVHISADLMRRAGGEEGIAALRDLEPRLGQLASELVWWARALRGPRAERSAG
jgi:NAD(P)H-dependent FMN reductase